jgi:hypothetical protein
MREIVTMPEKRTGEQILREITDFHAQKFSPNVMLIKRHRPNGKASGMTRAQPESQADYATKSGNYTWTDKKPTKPRPVNWEVERWNANLNWLLDMTELVSSPHH